jgi:Na+/H+ antiporter NhaD/arsenite permease-like protein
MGAVPASLVLGGGSTGQTVGIIVSVVVLLFVIGEYFNQRSTFKDMGPGRNLPVFQDGKIVFKISSLILLMIGGACVWRHIHVYGYALLALGCFMYYESWRVGSGKKPFMMK